LCFRIACLIGPSPAWIPFDFESKRSCTSKSARFWSWMVFRSWWSTSEAWRTSRRTGLSND
jgi:hypothetical protein